MALLHVHAGISVADRVQHTVEFPLFLEVLHRHNATVHHHHYNATSVKGHHDCVTACISTEGSTAIKVVHLHL